MKQKMEGIESRVSSLEKGHEVNCVKIESISSALEGHEKRIAATEKSISTTIVNQAVIIILTLIVLGVLGYLLKTTADIRENVAGIQATLSFVDFTPINN